MSYGSSIPNPTLDSNPNHHRLLQTLLPGKRRHRIPRMQTSPTRRLQYASRKPQNGNSPQLRRHTQTTRRRKRNMPRNQKPKRRMPRENAEHPTTYPTTLRNNARRVQEQIRNTHSQTLTPHPNVSTDPPDVQPPTVNHLTRLSLCVMRFAQLTRLLRSSTPLSFGTAQPSSTKWKYVLIITSARFKFEADLRRIGLGVLVLGAEKSRKKSNS